MKKLLLAAATTVAFVGAASAVPAASLTVGPSYNCMAPAVQKQPLAQLICASPAVSRAELGYVIAFQALRQISDDVARQTMREEANAFTQRTTAECNILTSGYLGGREPTPHETRCLLDHFDFERTQLLKRLSGDAMNEAQLSPEQTAAIQRALKEKGLLQANEAIDGVFGPTTRAAIGDWQRSVGQRATGFGSAAMLDKLQGSPQSPAPQAPMSPPAPSPTTPPSSVHMTAAPRADFSAADIPTIAETSRTNDIRFKRDYKGRTFSDTMVLSGIHETFNKGTYRISLKSSLTFGIGGGVDCRLSDPRSLDIAVNWNKGQRVEVSGVIEDTTIGDIQLSDCRMRAL